MTHFAGLTAAVLGLAIGTVASAQQGNNATNANRNNQNQNQNAGQDSSGRQTIRGYVAAVTVEGEMAIDYRTNRAVAAEMTILTVVGSPTRGGMDRSDAAANRNANADRNANAERDRNDRNNDQGNRAGENNRRRHNIYMLTITPRTKVRLAGSRNDANRNQANQNDANRDQANRNDANRNQANRNDANRNDNDSQGAEVEIAQLEVGDPIEVTANLRDEGNSGANANAGNANAAARSRHGRHRVFFGDAVEITIHNNLGGNRGEADSNRNNSNRDRDNNRDQDAEKKDRATDR